MKVSTINIKNVRSVRLRTDASYHLSEGQIVQNDIVSSPYPLMQIKDVSNDIFIGNRAKRIYVSSIEHGIPFLSSSDILKGDLEHVKLASKKYTPEIDRMLLQKGWTLISRSGTIGNCAFANAKHAQKLASEHVIRLVPNNILRGGLVYAYLASKYGHSLLTQGTFGAVIQHIEPDFVGSLPIPHFPETFQEEVDDLMQGASRLREEATDELNEAEKILKEAAKLRDLTPEDYDYYGLNNSGRKVSCFIRKRKDIDTTTINAFNHSERIRNTKASITCPTVPLKEVLLGGDTFSSNSCPSIEVKPEHGVMFINQKDIFDNIVKGKWISKRNISLDKLVEYGEVIVACDGTLGENELFCRALFANEDLQGALISTHFIRMKTNEKVPSGYLYIWLNSDYGFRFIRNCQAGTKLCHPIPKMFLEIPVPIVEKETMEEIDKMVKDAYTKRYLANCNECKAISLVEQEIESWNK